MFIVIHPDLSEQPGGGFTAHVETIGALPEILANKFWSQVKTTEDLEEELIGGDRNCFVLVKQYQQGLQVLLTQLEAKYLTVAEWLKYYLCNSPEQDLFHTDKIHYQSFAEFLLARLRLCQEIYPKAPELQSMFSPAGWWVNWTASELWWELYQLFQGESTYHGKREWYNLARQASTPYELQHENEGINRPQLLEPGTVLSPKAEEIAPALLALFLEDLCASEARTDPNFDRKHYKKYLREQRALHNAVRNSPHLQIGNISSGGFEFTQKNQQVSNSRKRRKM